MQKKTIQIISENFQSIRNQSKKFGQYEISKNSTLTNIEATFKYDCSCQLPNANKTKNHANSQQ
jgi:hypothetical protein